MTAQTSSNQRRPSDTPAECWPALFERTCFFLPSLLLPWRNFSETEFQPHYQVEDVGLAQFKSKLSTFSHPFSSPQRRIHILICSLPHRKYEAPCAGRRLSFCNNESKSCSITCSTHQNGPRAKPQSRFFPHFHICHRIHPEIFNLCSLDQTNNTEPYQYLLVLQKAKKKPVSADRLILTLLQATILKQTPILLIKTKKDNLFVNVFIDLITKEAF